MDHSYERATQLGPAMTVLAPVTIFALALVRAGSAEDLIRSGAGIAVTAGLHLIVMRTVRDRGGVVQRRLWRDWGGSPTVQRLRWSGQPARAVERLHRRVRSMTGVALPSAEEEAADPADADDVYKDAVARMREMTRDHARFPRVYSELVQYGTARNLYGMRPAGLSVAAVVLVLVAVLAALMLLQVLTVNWWSLGIAGAGALILGSIWLLRITPAYVRPAADRYADALLGTANEPTATT